jgi:D-glycero-alpha-D-manno-heptose 1-phosphate guanylyltransferase
MSIHPANREARQPFTESWYPTHSIEAIILAGGLGTRLRESVPDLPKCMAPVANRPFLGYLIDHLRMQGVTRFVFSLGYKSEVIIDYLEECYPTLDYAIVVEEEPFGTGGAIKLALSEVRTSEALVANGDTFFKVDLGALSAFHQESGSVCTLALKGMTNFERYGVVETDEKGRVLSFREKQFYSSGNINGGLYLIDKDSFLGHSFPQKFSFEKDYLEAFYSKEKVYGLLQDGYFIDIGIPEDFKKAQADFAREPFRLDSIDPSWTLLLDRDGVINDERLGEYVLNWDEFFFSPGVLESIPVLNKHFGCIIVVTNQRGVSKQLMTQDDLHTIHLKMREAIAIAGGRIDQVYYCTGKGDTCFHRKPNPGMAFQATHDFPQIDLSRTVMVGNKPSDMRFGRAAGVYTVFVTTTNPDQAFPHPDIDMLFPNLPAFAKALQKAKGE